MKNDCANELGEHPPLLDQAPAKTIYWQIMMADDHGRFTVPFGRLYRDRARAVMDAATIETPNRVVSLIPISMNEVLRG